MLVLQGQQLGPKLGQLGQHAQDNRMLLEDVGRGNGITEDTGEGLAALTIGSVTRIEAHKEAHEKMGVQARVYQTLDRVSVEHQGGLAVDDAVIRALGAEAVLKVRTQELPNCFWQHGIIDVKESVDPPDEQADHVM